MSQQESLCAHTAARERFDFSEGESADTYIFKTQGGNTATIALHQLWPEVPEPPRVLEMTYSHTGNLAGQDTLARLQEEAAKASKISLIALLEATAQLTQEVQ